MKWIVAGGKKWERCGWTGAGWYNSSKLLELGPEVAGQFRVVVLIGKIKEIEFMRRIHKEYNSRKI